MMLLINNEFLESKAPQRESDEAPAMPSQGEAWQPNPVAKSDSSSRPASRVRSTPMWQADFGKVARAA